MAKLLRNDGSVECEADVTSMAPDGRPLPVRLDSTKPGEVPGVDAEKIARLRRELGDVRAEGRARKLAFQESERAHQQAMERLRIRVREIENELFSQAFGPDYHPLLNSI
jgi:hypothetical protein